MLVAAVLCTKLQEAAGLISFFSKSEHFQEVNSSTLRSQLIKPLQLSQQPSTSQSNAITPHPARAGRFWVKDALAFLRTSRRPLAGQKTVPEALQRMDADVAGTQQAIKCHILSIIQFNHPGAVKESCPASEVKVR
jgi:hypothetical protein